MAMGTTARGEGKEGKREIVDSFFVFSQDVFYKDYFVRKSSVITSVKIET